MLNHEQFINNIEKWASLTNTDLELIRGVDCRELAFCKTGRDELNLKRESEGKTEYFHSQEDAADEAQKWFSSLELSNIKILYIFGIGLGYYYDAIKNWVHESDDRLLIFIEKDLAVIHKLLETEKGTEIINDKQVMVYFYEKNEVIYGNLIERISQLVVLKEFKITALNYYKEKYPDEYSRLDANINFNRNLQAGLAFEYMSFGKGFFGNFYSNLLYLPFSRFGNSMFGKFKGMPAIICGAGPSLEKNIDVLGKLKDKALIFAGGTAMNAINSRGILPHFGVGIDPNWYQFTRLVTNIAYEVPYFYRNRMFHNAFKLIHGDRLYVTGSIAYDVSKWFENKLDIHEEPIEEGFNVINLSLSIARELGCNPIIMVGVDLAYSNNQSYIRGLVSHPIHDKKRDFITKTDQEELLLKQDIYGNPIYTLWKWINESLWFCNIAMTNPDIVLVNSTEGGLGFPGIPNIPLKFMAENVLKNSFDMESRIQAEIQNASLPEKASFQNIIDYIGEFRESLIKCQQICLSLRNDFAQILDKLKKGEDAPPNLVSETIMKSLGDLDNEPAYTHLLNIFNEKYLQYYGSSLRHLEMEETPENEKKIDIRKTELNVKRFEFLHENIGAHLKVLDSILAVYAPEARTQNEMAKLPEEGKGNAVPEDEIYTFENDTITIIDPEMQLSITEKFSPARVESDPNKTYEDDSFNVDSNGTLQGQYIHRYYQGPTQVESFYLDGNLHGPSTTYGIDGKIIGTKWFIRGKEQGKAKYYYLNGTMKSLQRYRDGVQDGKQEYYYPNGRLKTIISYKDGLLDGEVLLYRNTGQLERELNFVKGKRHGYERGWNYQGLLILEVQWDMDRSTGVARSWYENGNLAKETVYGENYLPVEIRRWEINGKPWKDVKYVEGYDYFDKVAKQSDLLTKSLETIVKQVDQFTPMTKESDGKQEAAKAVDFKQDVDNLKKEMEHLKQLNVKLSQESGLLDTNQDEAIWKTPLQRKVVDKQLQDISKKMTADINQIHDVLESTIEYLIKQSIKITSQQPKTPPEAPKPPPTDEQNEQKK